MLKFLEIENKNSDSQFLLKKSESLAPFGPHLHLQQYTAAK